MRKLIFGLLLTATLAASAFGQDAKAEEILKQARAAIGSESKFKALQTLSAQGTARNSFGQMQVESELELEFSMPDKVRISNISPQGTRIRAYTAGTTWNDFIPGVGGGGFGGPGGGRGGNVFMGGGPGGPGGANNPIGAYMQTQQRREYIQILMAWFLAPPSGTTFTFVGEAPGPEGSKLNVIDAKTSDGIATRLYFNQETHQLIGLSYKAKSMRNMGGRGPGQGGQGGNRPPQAGQPGAQPAQPGQQGQAGQGGQQGQRREPTPEERAQREQRMKEMAEAFEKSPDVDYRWAFSDYKSVGGLNLPHRMTKIEAGTPNEEWEISKYKVNPKLAPDRFEKKEKPQTPAN